MSELTDRLRAWGRRFDPKSNERRLFNEAAVKIEELEQQLTADRRETVLAAIGEMDGKITPEAVEAAGGFKLLPWQRERLSK